ncbi:hypothetical protein ABZS88_41095, partial [Streptomyces sp. NPDC005480]
LLWRRMKLWELRSYEAVIKLEQERLVYQARLRSRFGRAWRRKAPVESLMPLRLARYGVPLAETAPSGLAAAGIEPALLPPAPAPAAPAPAPVPELERPAPAAPAPQPAPVEPGTPAEAAAAAAAAAGEESSPWFAPPTQAMSYDGGYDPTYDPEQQYEQWYEEQPPAEAFIPAQSVQEPEFPVPSGPNRTRQLGEGITETGDPAPSDEDLYQVFRKSIDGEGGPTPGTFHANVEATYGLNLEPRELQRYMEAFMQRLNSEFIEDHIA